MNNNNTSLISFSIWVDADSCPIDVKRIVSNAGLRLNVNVFYVANRQVPFIKNKFTKMIITEATPNAADDYIVEHSSQYDVVITRDIPLADRLVSRGLCVLNDRGSIFTENDIKEKLSIRNFNYELFQSGLISERTGVYGKKELQKFANMFDKVLQQKQKEIAQLNKSSEL